MNLVKNIRDFWLIDLLYSKFPKKKVYNEKLKRYEIWDLNWDIWVCFLPWRVTFENAKKKNLLPKNWRWIVYELPDNLVNPDPNISLKIQENIINDLKSLDFKKFNVLCYSLWTYLWFYVANNFDVNKIVAVVPGSKLWACVYEGVATKKISYKSVKLWYKTYYDYDKIIWKTNPICNLDNLPNDIEIHLSTHDFYIPTYYWNELIQGIKNKQKNLKVFLYKWKGHILTLLDFWKNNIY